MSKLFVFFALVAGCDVESQVEPDRRCVGFAHDFCGAWLAHLPDHGYSLGSGIDEPLQVDDFDRCSEQVIDGWFYDDGISIRRVGGCSEVFSLDVGACMKALAHVNGSIDSLNAMLRSCSEAVP